MIVWFGILTSICLAPAPRPAEPSLDTPSFLKEMEAQEKFLLTKFENEKIWEDETQKKKLLGLLAAARSVRSAKFAPILVKHVEFRRYPVGVECNRLVPREEAYPVYEVLQNLGVNAIPAIFSRLKELDPENRIDEQDFPFWLLIDSVFEIYERGGFGKDLTRRRIELEADKSDDTNKKKLLKSLKHFLLR